MHSCYAICNIAYAAFLASLLLQVLQEVAEASDEEGESGAASGQRTLPPAQRPGADSPLPPDQEAKRRQVLARLGAEDEASIQPAAEAKSAGQVKRGAGG